MLVGYFREGMNDTFGWLVHLNRHSGNAMAWTSTLGVCYELSSHREIITLAGNLHISVTHLNDKSFPTTVCYAVT